MLVVVQDTPTQLLLIAPEQVTTLVGSVSLARTPVAVAVSPGGHWAYVLEADAAGSFVQSVNLDRLQQLLPVTAGAEFKVGDDSQQLILSSSGARLYIPFIGDAAPDSGGVAILEVSETACGEILWRQLDGCPHCDLPDCVVLATVDNYHLGDKIEEQTDPPTDPLQNPPGVARINNRTRRLLPSTQVLTELIECLLEHVDVIGRCSGSGRCNRSSGPGRSGSRSRPHTNRGAELDA